MSKSPRNLSNPNACICDECRKKSSVLWKARYGLWLCPICWETIEYVSIARQKLINKFKNEIKY
jgi:hypothetical protein